MSEVTERFIERVRKLDARDNEGVIDVGYDDMWMMPREMMLALRDELELRLLLGQFKITAIIESRT